MQDYNYLRPYIAQIINHVNMGVENVLKENPALTGNDQFVVLFEAGCAVVGQILGSAFIQNPQLLQADYYKQVMTSVRLHADDYHRRLLAEKEARKDPQLETPTEPRT